MEHKKLIETLGFTAKDNTLGVFYKQYDSYVIEVDFEKEQFNYGSKIRADSKTSQNFSQPESWVVLECVDRLLEKGYKPEHITLEKTWKTGGGTSGRLDIFVTRDNDNGSAYLMIECKTWGVEFEKEFKNLKKDGGQLFSYFQQDKATEILMLYTSTVEKKTVRYRNEIIKIEEDYRQTSNVKDFYERWNKLPKSNGIFDLWTTPYGFQSKALTKQDLKELKQEDSSFIFNRFLEILRHNVVSDKPNAFNKIFTLFLCKIIDENRNENEQLHFQWLEGEDNHISFQKRLTDLYNRGMKELLEKQVTDVSDDELNEKFGSTSQETQQEIKNIITEIRLKKNNEFAIKEVFDDASFTENAKVVKEVVELLQVYRIRYNYRQQFLSDFFELLLTTGLKQEVGQFFTPVPIARFIIKSLPFQQITEQKLKEGVNNDLLPRVIDYAAGSGHFITESMEEIQTYIDRQQDEEAFVPTTKRAIKKWKTDQFDWAEDYVYAIEKDYRLVKTTKVSCYLHGDGLAKVIHGDGLGDFSTSTDFKDLLTQTNTTHLQDNKQFDVVISNPPYSVSAFKGQMDSTKSKEAFSLYDRLTDQSSEIECLFIERTKQLLKDGGVAGIILPSSILSNTGIYTQTREIILKYFDIIAITEQGSATFMATGTNTVTLFLKRRNNSIVIHIENSIKNSFGSLQEVTINGIEKPISKYLAHVWGETTFEDYKTLLQKKPNEAIEQHEIYKEYRKKLKGGKEKDYNTILALEQEKLLYFIIAYPQKIVLVKTGRKKEEKQFLGYEFSTRRGSEGIHPTQRSKNIDQCTQLYDPDSFTNPNKASTYIYRAFSENRFDLEIPQPLQQNISYQNLIDLLTFDRSSFEKSISLAVKKKVQIESRWDIVRIKEICEIGRGRVISKKEIESNFGRFPVYSSQTSNNGVFGYLNTFDFEGEYVTWTTDGIYAGSVFYRNGKFNCTNVCGTLKAKSEKLNMHFLAYTLPNYTGNYVVKVANPKLMNNVMAEIKIPLPPLDIQQKIVDEIETLEQQEQKVLEQVDVVINKKSILIKKIFDTETLFEISSFALVKGGKRVPKGYSFSVSKTEFPYLRVSDFKRESIEISNLKYIDEQVFKQIKNYAINKEDIYISIAGTIGLVGVVPKELDGKSLTENAAKIIINDFDKTNQKFVLSMLSSENVKNQIKERTKAVGVPKLAIKRIETIKIPLPPIEEQEKVVGEIEQIEQQIAELEAEITEIPQQKEDILKKYL